MTRCCERQFIQLYASIACKYDLTGPLSAPVVFNRGLPSQNFWILHADYISSGIHSVEAARLSSGPVRAVYSHLHLFIARSTVVRRCYRASHLARPQLGTRVRGQNSRRKTTDHRNQVRSTHWRRSLVIGDDYLEWGAWPTDDYHTLPECVEYRYSQPEYVIQRQK